jgi:nucleotide-binding universal stress UspA family protein
MKTCLVVANQTLPGEQLAAEVRQRIAASDRSFYVVVPLTPISHGATWEESESSTAAQARLEAFLDSIRAQGAEADGEIGDRDPIQAVRDVMRGRDVHEIILSTLPPGVSRWLQMDVPSRLERAVDVPVTVVTQEEVPAAATR